MISTTLRRTSHKVSKNFWHFEWCTKYRYKMMKRYEIKNLVEATIRKSAKENSIILHILKVLLDHVHMLVTLPNNMTDSKALQLLKGRSAFLIFRNRVNIRLRYSNGHFWAPSSCSVTVGYNDIGAMTKYIENQEMHHGLASC